LRVERNRVGGRRKRQRRQRKTMGRHMWRSWRG
jgi:hypothetical protein